jgi:flagellar basal body-associated protein FliL
MADNDDKKERKENKDKKDAKKSTFGRLLPIAIMIIFTGICAGGGFFLGRIFAKPGQGAGDPNAIASQSEKSQETQESKNSLGNKPWYYDLDAVVANLNEPSATRYVSASLTFEMNNSYEEKKGREFLDEKKPIIINWLTIYLSSLTIENIRGDKNLISIKSHIRESLNETLFPNAKPQIKDVLIKKFPIQ